MHIALLEMIIDPVCSLAFEAEPEEVGVMTRPPRDPEAPLITRRLLRWSVLQGILRVFPQLNESLGIPFGLIL